jgi:hypothetical protein
MVSSVESNLFFVIESKTSEVCFAKHFDKDGNLSGTLLNANPVAPDRTN